MCARKVVVMVRESICACMGLIAGMVLLGGLIGGSLMGNCVKGKTRKPNGDVLKVRQQQLRPASGPKPPGVTFTAQALAPRSPAFASHRGCFGLRGVGLKGVEVKLSVPARTLGPYLVRGQQNKFLVSKSGLSRNHSKRTPDRKLHLRRLGSAHERHVQDATDVKGVS